MPQRTRLDLDGDEEARGPGSGIPRSCSVPAASLTSLLGRPGKAQHVALRALMIAHRYSPESVAELAPTRVAGRELDVTDIPPTSNITVEFTPQSLAVGLG